MMNYRVLIVDDEEDMRHLLEMYLMNSGYHCLHALDGQEALQVMENQDVDIVLLDVMMPKMNGYEVCEQIRRSKDTPIIFISAKGEEWDKVKALKLGGDDYVVKPFSPGELMARIEALLRRAGKIQGSEKLEGIQVGNLTINQRSRKVTVDQKVINLTLKEYELLLFFNEHKNKVLSREQLLNQIWGMDYEGSLRTVDTHIKTLRMKLKGADFIQTVWGIGYKFEENT